MAWGMIVITTILLMASFLITKHARGELVLSWQRVPVRTVIHEIGYCYQVSLGKTWMSSHERPSPAKIFENGIPLGPGNSQHDDIRKIGKGKFSFWYNYLFFSASDNSDPGSNGRKYEILWPTPLNKRFVYILYGMSLISMLISCFVMVPIVRRRLIELRYQDKSEYLSRLFRCHGVRVLFNYARGLVLAILLYFGYMLSSKPEWTANISGRISLFMCIYSLCGLLGFYLFFLIKTRKNVSFIRVLIRTAAFLALLQFLNIRAENSIQSISALWVLFNNVIPFGLGVIAGLAYIQLFPDEGVRNNLKTGASVIEKWGLLLTVIISVVILLPEVTIPLVSRWDMSGYMDSHMYDFNAHNIATGSVLQGNAFVMPLYQYGMALIYFVFGHFFYVQQIVNALMAILTTMFLCLTAWNLFRSQWAVIIAGVMGAYARQLHAFIYITQIENWYLPLIAFNLFAWSCYWRRPVISHLVLLSLSAGLALNCRSQATLYYLLLIFAPFFITGLSFKKRCLHTFIGGLVLLVTLMPWSLRNYYYEGSFTPVSTQTEVIFVLNDHSIPLYGVIENNWVKYLDEYKRNYKDKTERLRVMKSDFIKNTFSDPVWLTKALYWRAVAFYNLLPPGVWAKNGPASTNWKVEFIPYVSSGYSSLFFIAIALTGLVTTPNRTTIFLFLGILAQMAVIIAVPPGDPRYGYPVIPYHMILGLFAFMSINKGVCLSASNSEECLFTKKRLHIIASIFFAVIIFMLLCHVSYGRYHLFRPLMEKAVIFDSSVKVDEKLPCLNDYYKWSLKKLGPAPVFKQGDKIRLKTKVTNYMLPPKTVGIVPYLPQFAYDPLRETFYYGGEESAGYIGITFFGATLNSVIREGDTVEAEGTILCADTENQTLAVWFWVKVEKAVKLTM